VEEPTVEEPTVEELSVEEPTSEQSAAGRSPGGPTATPADGALDGERLAAFAGRVLVDVAAAQAVAANHLGERLGLYRHLAGSGAVTAPELAAATDTNERLVLEWLRGQAVAGYVDHDPGTGRFSLPPEHAVVLAEESAPVFMGGAFEVAASLWADLAKVERAARGDGALEWGDHDERLYRGIRRVFEPVYAASLVSEWLPALDGVVERLERGGVVADVGCGSGASSILLATAFPRSVVRGFDRHEPSVREARSRADAERVDNVTFEALDAASLPDEEFDLVCFFDCLHDMGDPVAAAARARRSLAVDGSVLIVEPRAVDDPAVGDDPVSRLFYSGSLFLCTPCALAQGGDRALGAQAGPAAMTELLRESGFGTVRIATSTPFNTILEARR
jgi:SAM-dependent methyltransferase